MQVIQGDVHRPKRKRNAFRWTLAIGALMLAFPGTALATQAEPNRTSVDAGQARDAGLGRTTLAFGSGYGSPGGSPLVRYVQRRLERAGYFPGPIDGLFGPRTEQAVSAFQTSQGLPVDGIAGPHTWAALSSPVPTLGPGAGDGPAGSDLVRSLQRQLATVGDSPGPIDGRYGELTERAVIRFQQARGLPVTGTAGPGALALLSKPASPTGRSNPHPSQPNLHPGRPNLHPGRPNPLPQKAAPSVPPSRTGSRPAAVNPSPVTANPGGSGTLPWMTLVAVLAAILAVALLLIGVRYARRRDGDATAVAAPAGGEPSEPARGEPGQPARERTVLAMANGHDQAVAQRSNGNQIHTNGQRAGANWGHGGNGAEPWPSREDEADLFASAEAAAAFNLGLLLEAQGGMVEAQAAYGRADKRGHGSAASNLGRLLEQQGGLAEAEAAYRRADERGDATGAFNLGLLLEARGGMVEAQAAYGRADERGHGTAASNLGRLLEEQGGLAEAEAAYRRADERGDASGALKLGALLQKRGSLDEAAAAYGRASDRGNDIAASYLGVLLAEQGAVAEAEAAFRRADERGDAVAAFNLGVLLEGRGALIEAEQAYCRADARDDSEIADLARAALLDLRGEPGPDRVRRADAA